MANVKKVIEAGFILCITLLSTITITTQMIPTAIVSEEVAGTTNVIIENFDTVWYDGANTLSSIQMNPTDIQLIKASYTNGTARNIDRGIVTLEKYPFHFSIDVYDKYLDEEGFPYDAPDGYIYLNKTAVDSYFENSKDSVASKDIYYQTVVYQGKKWYRIYVEKLNPASHNVYVKEYNDPKYKEAWFSRGSENTIQLSNTPMFIEVTDKVPNTVTLKFSHPVSNAGQPVAFNKSYLTSIGITDPVFEWGEKKPWKIINYEETPTHYIINPEHFSYISVHMPTSGGDFAPTFSGTALGEISSGPNTITDQQTLVTTALYSGSEPGRTIWQVFKIENRMIMDKVWVFLQMPEATPPNYFIVETFLYESDAAGTEIELLGTCEIHGRGWTQWTYVYYTQNHPRTGAGSFPRDVILEAGKYYKIKLYSHTAQIYFYGAYGNPYPDGISSKGADFDLGFRIAVRRVFANVTRTWDNAGLETNTLRYTADDETFSGTPLWIKIPVSSNVETILSVINGEDIYVPITEVSNMSLLDVDTFYFDRGNKYVYIGMDNTTFGQTLNYTVNCNWFCGYAYPYDAGVLNPVQSGKWWNDKWTYRKKLTYVLTDTFKEHDIPTIETYRKNLTIYRGNGTDSSGIVYLNGHCASDFSDLRFVQNIQGYPTKIPYLITSSSPTYVVVSIYFKVDGQIDGTDDNEIYIYYGILDTQYNRQETYGTVTSRPNSAGDYATMLKGGTSPAPTNWESCDEGEADDDVTYVYRLQSSGGSDLYNMEDAALILSEKPIESITVYVRYAYTGYYLNCGFAIKTHGTAYQYGIPTPYGTGWKSTSVTIDENPFTSLAWTASEIDSLQVGPFASMGTYDTFKCSQIYVDVTYVSGYILIPIDGESGEGVGSFDYFTGAYDPVWMTTNSQEYGPTEAFNVFRIQGVNSEQDSFQYNAASGMENAILRIGVSERASAILDAQDNDSIMRTIGTIRPNGNGNSTQLTTGNQTNMTLRPYLDGNSTQLTIGEVLVSNLRPKASGDVTELTIGNQKSLYEMPTGVGYQTQLAPMGDNENWKCVDEVPTDSDTTYVKAVGNVDYTDYYKMAEPTETTGTVHAVAQDTTYIYAGGTYGRIMQYWKSNMTNTGLQTAPYGSTIRSIAVDDTYIYVGGEVVRTVKKYWKSNMTLVAESSILGFYSSAIVAGIILDGDYLYVGAWGYIYRMWKSNLTIQTTGSYGYISGYSIYSIAYDSTHVYAAGLGGNTAIYKYLKTDLSKVTDIQFGSSIQTVYGLTIDGTYLYAAGTGTAGNRMVRKYTKSTMVQAAATADYGDTVFGLAMDDTYVYYGGATTNKIYRAPKSTMVKDIESFNYLGTIRGIINDTTYVYAGRETVNRTYKFLKSDLKYNAETTSFGFNKPIQYIRVDELSRKTHATAAAYSAYAYIRLGTTNTLIGSRTLPNSVAYTYGSYSMSTNPLTSNPWNWSDIKNMEVGLRLDWDGGSTGYEARTTQVILNIFYIDGPDGNLNWRQVDDGSPDGLYVDKFGPTTGWKYDLYSLPDATLTLRPNAVGIIDQFSTYDEPENYQCVDEVTADGDDTKVRATSSKNVRDSYNIPEHTTETGPISSFTMTFRAKGGYSTETCAPALYIGGSYYDGTSYVMSNVWTEYSYSWYLDPSTGAAWTWSQIDSLQIGMHGITGTSGDLRVTQVFADVNYMTTTETRRYLSVEVFAYVNPLTTGATFRTELKTNGVKYDGSVPTTPASTWTTISTKYYTNPQTGLVWTASEINDLQVGIGINNNNVLYGGLCDQVYVKIRSMSQPVSGNYQYVDESTPDYNTSYVSAIKTDGWKYDLYNNSKGTITEETFNLKGYDSTSTVYSTWSDDEYTYACGDFGIRAYAFEAGIFTLKGTRDDGGTYQAIWGDGSYIYTGCGDQGIRAYTFDGELFVLKDTDYVGASSTYQDIWGDGTYIYVAGCASYGLIAYSFDGNSFDLLATRYEGVPTYGVWGDGTYIYANVHRYGIYAYTFNGTAFNYIASRYDGSYPNSVYYEGLWGDGTYIYSACYKNGIRAYTFNGASFSYIASVSDGTIYNDVWGDGNYIYAAQATSIRLYDFNGATFTLMDSDGSGTSYNEIFGDAENAYAACSGGIYAYRYERNTSGTQVDEITIYALVNPGISGASFRTEMRTNGVTYDGTPVTPAANTWTLISTKYLTNPGGGTWTWQQMYDLQMGIGMLNAALDTNISKCTQMYVILKYRSAPDAGRNFEKVDDEVPDYWTTYVNTINSGGWKYDLYALPSAENAGVRDETEIHNITVYALVNPYTTGATFRTEMQIGGITYHGGTETPPANTWTIISTKYDSNPGGGNWTKSQINVLQIGVGISNSDLNIGAVCTQAYVTIQGVYYFPGNYTQDAYWYGGMWNGSFYLDTIRDYAFFRVGDIIVNEFGARVFDMTVNITYGGTFLVRPPAYLDVGSPWVAVGLILDAEGDPISGMIGYTYLYYNDTGEAVDNFAPASAWNCTNGNFFSQFATNALAAGRYNWQIQFRDAATGMVFKHSNITDIGVFNYGGGGGQVYVDAYIYYTFYDIATGTGIDDNFYKVYIADYESFGTGDRVKGGKIGVLKSTNKHITTGEDYFIQIRDFNDNILPISQYDPTLMQLHSGGDYAGFNVTRAEFYLDMGVYLNQFRIKNMNDKTVYVTLKRTDGNPGQVVGRFIPPYEESEVFIPDGWYNLTVDYYDNYNMSFIRKEYPWVSSQHITTDTFYWIAGYSLADIIIAVWNTNTTIMDQLINVGVYINNEGAEVINQTINMAGYFANLNTTIVQQVVNLMATIDNVESNISMQVNSVWLSVNNTNTNIVNQSNLIKQMVTNSEANITTQLNAMFQVINNTNLTAIVNQFNMMQQNIHNMEMNLTNQTNLIQQLVENTNTSITNQLTGVYQHITNVNSNITTQANLIRQDINNSNSNITTQLNAVTQKIINTNATIHTQLNLMTQQITNANNTIHTQLNGVQTQINNTRNNITSQVNSVYVGITNNQTQIKNQLNLINANITNTNSSIHTQITGVSAQITNLDSNITNQTNLISAKITNMNVSLSNQINSVLITIQNNHSEVMTQLNAILAKIVNTNTSIVDQINLLWAGINNTNSTVVTQINGIHASITTFQSNVTNSFSVIQSNISNMNTTIVNLINSTNASMMARMLGILDNVSNAGVSVFDKAVEILHNISLINVNLTSTFFDAVDNISHMQTDINNAFSDVFSRIGNVSNALDFYMNAVMNAMLNLNISTNLTDVYDLLNEVLYNFQTPHEWKIPNVIYTYNDTTAPLSTIHASVRVNGSIEATWHSVDDSPQTVAYVDVYYKVGTGTWKLWKSGLRDTGSLYFTSDIESLTNSSIYWFRVISTDSSGNIEGITQLNTCNITYTTGTTYVPADAQAMVQNILVNPLFLIGLAAIICIIIIVAYLERRRRKIPPKQEVYSQQEYQEQTNLPYYEERMNR